MKKFKAVRDSKTIGFTPLTVFNGKNGSGKSSIVEAMETFQILTLHDIDEAMQKAKAIFVDAGFNASDIQRKIEPKKNGVARDIVEEARSGYSIIVVGRRGFSGIREFIMGSVSQKILHAAKELSVLMVN